MKLKDIWKELKSKEMWDKIGEICSYDLYKYKKYRVTLKGIQPKEYVFPCIVMSIIVMTSFIIGIVILEWIFSTIRVP